MNPKRKNVLVAVIFLIGLAVGEQFGMPALSYSESNGGTAVDVRRRPASVSELTYTVEVDRPLTRWIPFVKFGETVYRGVYFDRTNPGATYEHVVRGRSTVWVIGFCSTARFEHLADNNFDRYWKEYLAEKARR